MGMQQSEELSDVATVLFRQLSSLGVQLWSCGFVLTDNEKESEFRMTNPEGEIEPPLFIPNDVDPATRNMYVHWKEGDRYFAEIMEGDALKNHYDILLSLPKSGPVFQEILDTGNQFPLWQQNHAAYFSHGYLIFITTEPFEDQNLLERFAKVFEQTYTRFLDLQKAEAQAREAQIEAALERVRGRAMAIRKSDELKTVIAIIFKELNQLGFDLLESNLMIFVPASKDLIAWGTGPNNTDLASGTRLQYFDHPFLEELFQDIEAGKKFRSGTIGGTLLKSYLDKLYTLTEFKNTPKELIEANYKVEMVHFRQAIFKHGFIELIGTESIPVEKEEILKRFAKVIDLTYTRFDDIVQAEAQAREAQIEAALERIRSRTMAMRKSEELQEVVATVAERLHDLGIIVDAGGVIICTYFQNSKDVRHWIAAPDFSYSGSYLLPYFDHVIFNDAWESRLSGDEFFTRAYSVEEKDSFFRYAFEHSDYQYFPDDFKQWMFAQKKHTLTFAWTKNSALLIPSHTGYVPSATERDILKRFAQVFEQAYIRFLDIQKAEVQAKEALKQASLDRIRGEIASMRTTEDLNRITPVIWRELQALEVPFIRCGVFIIDEEKENVQVYLTTPDGKALGVLNLAFASNELTKNTIEHWRKKRIFKTHWNKEEFINWTKSMMEIGQVQSAETYQGSSAAPESLNLHFVPFRQGMLYVGDIIQLTNEKLELVKTLADAFSIAYARYEDFKNIEDAKNKIEITLNELKAAQTQLIQSEKMASLGELTAGIAHEIQNPLNFVNNFSEVSTELLGELKEELANGDLEEVKPLPKM